MLKFGALTAAIAVGVTILSGMGYFFLPRMSNYLGFLLYSGGMVGWCYIWGDNGSATPVLRDVTEIAISVAINASIGFAIGIVAGAVPFLFGMTKDE